MCSIRHGLFAVLLLSFTLSSYARIDTAIVGRLEVVVFDEADGARYEYSLRTAEGSRVRLKLQNGLPAVARANATMRARGQLLEDGTLQVHGMTRVRERAGIQANALLPRGESVLVLIGYFAGTNPPCSKATVENVFFNSPLSVKNYYLTSSHGGLHSFTGRVLDPIVLNGFSPGGVCQADAWADYLDSQATLQGINLADYTRTQYLVPSCGGLAGGFATIGLKRSWVFVCSVNVMGHELGHSLGMDHAWAYGTEYADPYDIMHGSLYADPQPELNAQHRVQLNFMPDANIKTVTASGVYTLGALEVDGQSVPQVLRIARAYTGDWIFVSFRNRTGPFDAMIDPPAATHVYHWDGGRSNLRKVLENGIAYDEAGVVNVKQLSNNGPQATILVTFPTPTTPPVTCSNATTLCLRGNRFRVTATYKLNGQTSNASAIPFSEDTGYFWFFSPDNTEIAVKVLDGNSVNGKFWVYFGGLTNLEYTIVVTDTTTGQSETYVSASGNLCGGADTNFGMAGRAPAGVPPSATSGVGPATTCTADADTLCLQPGGDVIKVESTYFSGSTAMAGLLPQTLQAGYFTFFSPANVELLTKVLDGRSINNRYWIFTGALSDVAYTVTYTNIRSGRWVKVTNPQGNYCGTAITNLLY